MPSSIPYPIQWRSLVLSLAAPAVVACSDASAPVATDATGPAPSQLSKPAGRGPVILRGTLLTPDGVIKHGYVGIADGRIASISSKPPALAGAPLINTEGIILPGFVDLHNHVP
jgi:hypothetical protein